MSNSDVGRKIDFSHIHQNFVKKINSASSQHQDAVDILKNSPKKFLSLLNNKVINFSVNQDSDLVLKVFYHSCNMLKEIEREMKIVGIQIMNYIVDFIPEEYFLNAYVFEKDLATRESREGRRKKFISVGDYEINLSKADTTSVNINYGFFAAALEEQKKEIKIACLKLISHIGSNPANKEFALKSFKYTIELVNDEEDEVRYESIKTLTTLICNFKKIDFQSCEIIFFNLKEKSLPLRKFLYSLYAKIHNENSADFEKFVKILFENLKIFPEDKLLIFQCLKEFAQNNIEHVNDNYIVNLLDLDSNFLMSESNWNDLAYNSSLIILQEYIKKDKFNSSLPKFFIKHFNYLSDRYPKIFDKNLYKFLSLKKEKVYLESDNNLGENIKQTNAYKGDLIPPTLPTLPTIPMYDHEFEDNFDKINAFFTSTSLQSLHLNDILKYIFSFLNILIDWIQYKENSKWEWENDIINIDDLNDNILDKDNSFLNDISESKLLHLANKIIDIIEIINFTIKVNCSSDEDKNAKPDLIELYHLNHFIIAFIVKHLVKSLSIVQEAENVKGEINRIINFNSNFISTKFKAILILFHKKSKEGFINHLQILQETYHNLQKLNLSFPNSNFTNAFPLVQIMITNPKMNLNYIHIKDKENTGIKYPFFLQVTLKVKSISYSDSNSLNILLCKSLHVIITKLNEAKKVDINPTSIKISDLNSGIVTIKAKVPIILEEEEENSEYAISAYIKSSLKFDFKEMILKGLDLETNSLPNSLIQISDKINFSITY